MTAHRLPDPDPLAPQRVQHPTRPSPSSTIAELRRVAERLGRPLQFEYDSFECIGTARIGDFYACGLDECDAYESLLAVIRGEVAGIDPATGIRWTGVS